MPQSLRIDHWIDHLFPPPTFFAAGVMEQPMMGRTQRHYPFVARLRTHRAELGESEVVRLAWPASANDTRLPCDELEMILVTDAPGRCNRQQCFVDGVVGAVAAFRLTRAISNVRLLRPATVL